MDQNENIQDSLVQENVETENSGISPVLEEGNEEQKTELAPQNSASSEDKPIISLKNINIYQRKILILPQVSMSVRKGEFVYLDRKSVV